MSQNDDFDLQNFLPYLLNLAAERSSLDFQTYYKTRYGMLRMEWRVLFHLGRYGDLTATQICERARIHKTKVSRAVAALEAKRYLRRETAQNDRRQERLTLTPAGQKVFQDLTQAAQRYDDGLVETLSPQDAQTLKTCLRAIAGL